MADDDALAVMAEYTADGDKLCSSGGDFTETALRIAGADVEEAQWQHDQAQTQAAVRNVVRRLVTESRAR